MHVNEKKLQNDSSVSEVSGLTFQLEFVNVWQTIIHHL